MKINHWPNEAREAYEALEYKLAEMTADRDSWEAQADERVKDCEMFINQLAASKAREEAYRAEVVNLSGELSAKDSEIDRLNRIKSRTRQEELVQQLAEREKQIVLLRVELKRIADQLFDVLGGSTKGYYHGLKENMCVALAALAAIFEREGT